MRHLLNILSARNRVLSCKRQRESKSKLTWDLEWKEVDITDQFTHFKGIQVTSNTSCRSEIGPLRYGAKTLSPQSCKPDIIKAIWQTVAGPQLAQVYSSWLAWTASLMFGISSTDKTKLLTLRKSLTLSSLRSQSWEAWPRLVIATAL